MVSVEVPVKPLVYRMVCRSDADRHDKPEENARGQRPGVDPKPTQLIGEDDAGHDKDMLGRVIEPHYGQIICQAVPSRFAGFERSVARS